MLSLLKYKPLLLYLQTFLIVTNMLEISLEINLVMKVKLRWPDSKLIQYISIIRGVEADIALKFFFRLEESG